AQQRQLFGLRDTPKKPHPLAEVKRTRECLESGPVIAGPGDLECCLPMLHLRERTNDMVDALVLFEAAEVRKDRPLFTCCGQWAVAPGIYPRVYDLDMLARDAPTYEILGCALADRLERNLSIDTTEWPLGEPNRGRQRRRELLKDSSAEQVRYERDDAPYSTPPRRIQWNLVHVLHQDVERWGNVAEYMIEIYVGQQWKCVARSDAVHLDIVEPRVGRTSLPTSAE